MAENNKQDPLTLEIPEEDREQAEKINKKLDAAQNYKQSSNLYEQWNEYQNFWESDQWPQANEKTKNYPRPCTNHFAEIIDMKVAGLTYEKPSIYFEPKKGSLKDDYRVPVEPVEDDEKQEEGVMEITPAELLNNMTEDVMEQNDIENVLEHFCRSAALLGNGILHVYWDNTISETGIGAYIGEVKVMEIDIADFYVGDPKEQDIQKQPYIMITERRPLEQVKEDYRIYADEVVSTLQAEAPQDKRKHYDYEHIEQEETDYVDVIHYWEKRVEREEKEHQGQPVTVHNICVDYYVVCQEKIIRKHEDFYPNKKYPFVNFAWIPRRKNFYAKPESADLINNQKELNRLQGIALLGAYKTGLPNIVYKEHFVNREDIPVGPGGNVIKDETPPGQGWSVDYLQPPTVASYIPLLRDAITSGMREVSGVHEAWSGQAPSAHLNASAIMALQEAAGVRIRGIQRRFFSAVRDMGELILGFMKQYYTEKRLFRVFVRNIEGLAWFDKTRYDNLQFDVKVSKASASPYAKTVIASTLDNMLERGVIDGDLYMRMLPPEVFPKAKELLELKEKRTEEQQQMMVEQQKAIVDEIVSQVVEQAREQGTEITPEALQEMREMVKEQAEEEEV